MSPTIGLTVITLLVVFWRFLKRLPPQECKSLFPPNNPCKKQPDKECAYKVTFVNGRMKASGHFQCCKVLDQLKAMNRLACNTPPGASVDIGQPQSFVSMDGSGPITNISFSKSVHEQALRRKEFWENLDTSGPRQ